MLIHEDRASSGHVIKSYDNTSIQIDDTRYTHSLIVSPHYLLADWDASFEQLKPSHFECILQLNPPIFILGTGKQARFPSKAIYEFFAKHHIGFECMNTGAACRTYTVLASEGRKVAAGLLF